jgi:DNA-binding NtrC family response regulator
VSARVAKATAVVVGHRKAAEGRLRRLRELLGQAGASVVLVETAEDAAAQALLAAPGEPLFVVVDATREAGQAPADQKGVLIAKLDALTGTLPQAAPIAVAADPPAALVIAALRHGAVDFIDLSSDGQAELMAALDRVHAEVARRARQRVQMRDLRDIIEDFLRDLIRTERRSIDLEHKLEAAKDRRSGDDRPPVVLVIEDDKEVADTLVDALESAGLSTFAFLTGEDAVLEVQRMTKRSEPIDLALVDAVLPQMNGFDAIRAMRELRPGLAAVLMTGYSDEDRAAAAADLGVVGYVLKPFDDIAGLVERVSEQAAAARDATRDRLYLERIKARHEKVLGRYRALSEGLDE